MDVEVTQDEEWTIWVRDGGDQRVELIHKVTQGSWGAVDNGDSDLDGSCNLDDMVFERLVGVISCR